MEKQLRTFHAAHHLRSRVRVGNSTDAACRLRAAKPRAIHPESDRFHSLIVTQCRLPLSRGSARLPQAMEITMHLISIADGRWSGLFHPTRSASPPPLPLPHHKLLPGFSLSLHSGRPVYAHRPSGGRGSRQRSPDARQPGADVGLLLDPDSDGPGSGTRRGRILMYLLIVVSALVIALFTGAVIVAHGIDPCALETRDWSMIDPDCSGMRITTALKPIGWSRTATVTRVPDGALLR
jgi:hypothetical protein